MTEVQDIPTGLIFGNPNQPRRIFDQAELEDLAASIQERGQLQPCVVTTRGDRFMLTMGERRWRAQCLRNAETVPCIIREMTDAEVLIDAIVENRLRVDVTPLEEAHGFQAALDMGLTEQELSEKLGLQQAWRIRERTCLLRLRPEYQALLAKGQLGGSAAFEMAQLQPGGQDALFGAIRRGECSNYSLLRSTALVLRDAEAQTDFLSSEEIGQLPTPPTANERQLAKGLERRIGQVAAMLRATIVDHEVRAVQRVDPTRAGTLADLVHAMVSDLRRLEVNLRTCAETQVEEAA